MFRVTLNETLPGPKPFFRSTKIEILFSQQYMISSREQKRIHKQIRLTDCACHIKLLRQLQPLRNKQKEVAKFVQVPNEITFCFESYFKAVNSQSCFLLFKLH